MPYQYTLSANDLEDAKEAIRELHRSFGTGAQMSPSYTSVLAQLDAAEDLGNDKRRISLTPSQKDTLSTLLSTQQNNSLYSRIFGSAFRVSGGRRRSSSKTKKTRRSRRSKTRRTH